MFFIPPVRSNIMDDDSPIFDSKELQAATLTLRDKFIKPIMERREELVEAWVAKYGFDPKDAVIEQRVDGVGDILNLRVWVERDRGIMCETHGYTINNQNQRIEDLMGCVRGNHGPAVDIIKDDVSTPGCLYCGLTL